MRFIYVRASFQSELRTPNPVRTEDGGDGDEEEIAKAIQRAHGSRAHGGSGRLREFKQPFTQPLASRHLFTIVNRTRKHVPSERARKEKKPADDKKCGCGGGRYGAKEGRTAGAGAGAVVKDSTVSGRAASASAAVISKAHDAAATTAPAHDPFHVVPQGHAK